MMNQGENAAETFNSAEKHQINDSHQVDTASNLAPNCAVTSWATQVENHNLRDNGVLSSSSYNHDQSSSYNHDQQVDPILKNTQDGTNPAPIISTSSSGPTNVAQGYSGYAAYANTDPYGYSGTYYNQYQQQPSHYQHQSSQYQQQPNHYQQQLSQSYSHQVGTYQNTGAAYQALSSFHNAGSYAGPASYSGTYYNHGNYQTSGNYTNGTYGTQTNLWHGGQYATYGSQQYPNYAPDSNSAYGSTSAVPNSQYQDHYKQWEDYYNQTQTEVSCAPGTENLSGSTASSVNNSVISGNGGYAASNNQIPAAYTSSWRPECSSSELAPVQPVAASGSNPAVYWNNGGSTFQNDLSNTVQVATQQRPEVIPAYDSFQTQQTSSFSQSSTSIYPNSYQVLQSHQSSFQTVTQPTESTDSHRVNKLQIPTNPRINSNIPLCLSKDKDSSLTSPAPRPAYISVPVQKPNEKVFSHEEADSMLKPGVFPKSLRGYVERALARSKNDWQKAACQLVLKEIITKATADGTLHTKDWDTEPLFPMPTTDANNNQDTTFSTPSAVPKSKSPSRRGKSRWEPIPEDKMVASSNISNGTAKYVGSNNKQFSGGKIQDRVNLGTKSSDNRSFGKNVLRPAKRQRLGDNFNAAFDAEISSGSDEEQSLTKYSAAAIALADSPEEKRRRENRSKRFDRGHGNRVGKDIPRTKDVRPGVRRASALVLNKNFEEIGSRAVEDIDWDSFTVKGTCQEIEKRYLRLTSAPDPAMVRPEEVLEKGLLMVQNSEKNYFYKCDQLKSIRQDLTVQRIRNDLTVKVYETHARLAIEFGDLPEYNQCQSQLKTLYAEGIPGCHTEFAAYNLLCVLLHSSNYRDLLLAMSRLSANAKKDVAVEHALAVRRAVTSENYVMFFRLYKSAPNLNTFLMDLYVEKMRYAAIKCMSRSHRPTVPVSYVSQILGFTDVVLPTSEASDEREVDRFDECVEWLKAHGACIIKDNSGETLLDMKASVSTLYMPEPEDAVSHGDTNLAVNDFLARNPA